MPFKLNDYLTIKITNKCCICIATSAPSSTGQRQFASILELRNLKMKSTKGFLTLVLIFLLTGCGTVSGLGDDLKKASEWTKDKLSKQIYFNWLDFKKSY